MSTTTRRAALLGAAAAGAAWLAGCSATRSLDLAVPRGTYRSRAGIAYGADPRHRLDVYLPPEEGTDAPLVVFFYGGNWTQGERGDYRFMGEALASAGIVTVVADYRLSPQVRWREVLADCALATRWAFEQAPALGASRERIHVMGHSAGAYNAAMLALDARWLAAVKLQPSRLAGWIGIAGPYDFLPISEPRTQVAFDWPDTPADSQPIRHASRASPPALLMAARNDTVVDHQRSTVALAQRLEAAGADVRLRLYDRVNHVTVIGAFATPLRWMAPVREEVVAFVRG